MKRRRTHTEQTIDAMTHAARARAAAERRPWAVVIEGRHVFAVSYRTAERHIREHSRASIIAELYPRR